MSVTVEAGKIDFKKIIAICALSSIPFFVWLVSVGDINAYISHETPPGQLIYLFSKLLGLYAYYFMALQLSLGFSGKRSHYFYLHPALGMLTVAAVISHFVLFIIAASFRTGHWAIDILIPTFSNGFYKSAISYGVLGAYCLGFIVLAGIFQRKWRFFRMLHKFAIVVVALGWIHSFSIGTETRSLVTMIFYISLLCLALHFLIRKLLGRVP